MSSNPAGQKLAPSGRARLPKENLMGSTADKIKGYTNEAVGKAKQGIGKAIVDDKMRV